LERRLEVQLVDSAAEDYDEVRIFDNNDENVRNFLNLSHERQKHTQTHLYAVSLILDNVEKMCKIYFVSHGHQDAKEQIGLIAL